MPGRRIPPEIMGYLGPCRQPRGFVEKVIDQCGLAKLEGELGDFEPLIVVMALVTEEFHRKSLDDPKVRKAWCTVIQRLQEDASILEHNKFIACRRCDQEFEPLVDERLLTLFLAWHKTRSTKDRIAIHLCPACGGTIEAKATRKYDEDSNASYLRSVEDEDEWADTLLEGGYDFDA
jgi:hypothetical protein